jgi:CheY-like chemotaxis protein
LSNAAKYTHEGLISLRVATGIRQEEKDIPPLTITVTDTGIGIKSEDMDNLFSDFTRFDMVKNKNIEGSGLGLAITRSLCRAMGGDITVSSEYGKGSVFVATILQSAADGEKLAVVDNPRVKIILLYDHRKEYVKSLTETLRGLGVIVVIADDEDDFQVKLSSGGFSFVFVSEVVLEQARMIIKEKSIHTVLVLLSDIGKVAASENVMVIPMPAYAVSVANVINGKTGSPKETKNAGTGFIAPDARLLVVDDIPANLVVAEGLLSPYKARIDTCSSGARSLDLIKMHRYDLVFMDHMMPEMDGIETVRIVRQWEKEHKSSAVPIVALTANAISGMREMFLEEGFNDYLSKPIDTFRLNEIMKVWISQEKQKPKEIEDRVEEPDIVKDSVIQGIDLKQGQERYPGKAYLDVIRAWCMYTPALLEKLQELTAQPLTEKTIGEYTIAVHGLKGSTYGICAESTAKKAADLEAASRRKDTEFIKANTGFLIEEASVLLRELEKFIAGVTQPAESKPLREYPDADLLSQLFKAGEQYRSIQMEEILCELESFQYKSGGDLIQWLREQMNELEYDAINERLKKELSAIKTADTIPTGDIKTPPVSR